MKVLVMTYKVLQEVKQLEPVIFRAKIKVFLFGDLMDETARCVPTHSEDLGVRQVKIM